MNSTLDFTIYAQNSTDDYVQQACLAAMSIRLTNPKSKICLILTIVFQQNTKIYLSMLFQFLSVIKVKTVHGKLKTVGKFITQHRLKKPQLLTAICWY